MVGVPVRAAPTFPATVNVTTPDPLPLAPPAMLIHESLLTAVHEQYDGVVTATDSVVAALPIDWVSGEIE